MSPLILAGMLLVQAQAQPFGQQQPQAPQQPQMQGPACFQSFEVLKNGLAEKYHEEPTAAGITMQGQMLVVFTSPEGATFTVAVTSPDGKTCVVSAGANWQLRPATAIGEPT